MKKLICALAFAIFTIGAFAQDIQNVKEVKNVILMIPDGCSLGTISAARWDQWYMNPDAPSLPLTLTSAAQCAQHARMHLSAIQHRQRLAT